MVRTELLRAKSLHAEVHYLKDLQRVGDAKRNHDQQSKAVKDKENQFWKEAIKGQTKAVQSPVMTPQTAQQTATQLDRIWRAHSQLKEAHQKRETSAKQLQEGLATLSTSKQRIESLQKLVSKAEKVRANRIESRMSEEVAELVGTTRAVNALKEQFEGSVARLGTALATSTEGLSPGANPAQQTVPNGGVATGLDTALVSPGQSAVAQTTPTNQSAAHQSAGGQNAGVQDSPLATPLLALQNPLGALPVPPTMVSPQSIKVETAAVRAPEAVSQLAAPFQITNVSFARQESHAALTVSASLGRSGPVNLVITKGEGGNLKVLVDPGVSGLASQLSRDKGVLQSRLQALGLKVNSLEVGAAEDSPQQTRKNSRKVFTDPDEELIA